VHPSNLWLVRPQQHGRATCLDCRTDCGLWIEVQKV
jgi:hypothetical protein